VLAEQHQVNPPVGYVWWWLVLAGSVAGLAVLWWWARRILRQTDGLGTTSLLEQVRAQTLAEIDAVARRCAAGELDGKAVAVGIGGAVRRFAGTVTDGDADYSTLPMLRRTAVKDPRLEPVVELLAWLAPAAYDGITQLDVERARLAAREVVSRWQ